MLSEGIHRLRDKLDSRTYIVIKNAVLSMGIKGLSIIVGLLLMPVYAKFLLNQSVLGVWLTIISMLSWIFTFDLGIGNGLRNELTIAVAHNNKAAAKKLITSAYVSAAAICVILAVILFAAIQFIDFLDMFHISTSAVDRKTMTDAITLLIGGVLIQFVLKLINSILLALHKAAIPNALNLMSNALLLVYLILAPINSINKNFATLSVVYVITTNLPLFIATIAIFLTSLRECIPSLKDFNLNDAKRITKIGIAFFWLQVLAMIIFSTNNFLISIFVSAEEVIPFQIYFKLFSLISTFFALGMIPMWSSIADAQAKNDFRWIIKARKNLYIIMGIAALGEVLVLLMSKFIVTIWMGPQYVILNEKLIIFFAILDLVNIWTLINAQIANGLGKLKNQLLFVTFGAVINFPLSYLFSIIYKSWVAIAIANIISLLPFCISETFSTAIYLRKRASSGDEKTEGILNLNTKKEYDAQ